MVKQKFAMLLLIHIASFVLLGLIIHNVTAALYPGSSFLIPLISILSSFLFSILLILYLYKKHLSHFDEFNKELAISKILYKLLLESINIKSKSELFSKILENAVEALPNADKGTILLVNDDKKTLQFAAAYGYPLDQLQKQNLPIEYSFPYLFSHGRVEHPVIVANPAEYNEKNLDTTDGLSDIILEGIADIKSVVSSPIIYDNELYGILNIDSHSPNAYDQSDIDTMEIFVLELINVIRNYSNSKRMDFVLHYDMLTNCLNHEHFTSKIANHLENSDEFENLVLLSIEVKNIKEINQKYGFECGDRVLKRCADVIRKFAKEEDSISRYTGNEFKLLALDMTSHDAKILGKKIETELVENPMFYNNTWVDIIVDFELAFYPDDLQFFKNIINLSANNPNPKKVPKTFR